MMIETCPPRELPSGKRLNQCIYIYSPKIFLGGNPSPLSLYEPPSQRCMTSLDLLTHCVAILEPVLGGSGLQPPLTTSHHSCQSRYTS